MHFYSAIMRACAMILRCILRCGAVASAAAGALCRNARRTLLHSSAVNGASALWVFCGLFNFWPSHGLAKLNLRSLSQSRRKYSLHCSVVANNAMFMCTARVECDASALHNANNTRVMNTSGDGGEYYCFNCW